METEFMDVLICSLPSFPFTHIPSPLLSLPHSLSNTPLIPPVPLPYLILIVHYHVQSGSYRPSSEH